MKTQIVNPNIRNFIKSLRDVGYTFEIAVADIIDNSITANASRVMIHCVAHPEIVFSMFDNGKGMSETELIEAMRLATKDPDSERDSKDLGRFGLGLKTASFSQCKKLTVISKINNKISLKQWDLDYIFDTNEWSLITPDINDFKKIALLDELKNSKSGTLVIWQNIDRYQENLFSHNIETLRNHLALVFHRFLDGTEFNCKLKIILNNNPIKPFDPFNSNHNATLQKATEKIKIYESEIKITPFILPHHKNLSQQEWEEYSTQEGYVKSQGFYLYRANRLLIHGTWWGLHKATDEHKLVRIKIDISNDQDKYWGIDIKKSTANPLIELKNDLKRIIAEVTKEGSKPFSVRGRKINDKTITKFWQIIPKDKEFHFGINKEHPIYYKLIENLQDDTIELLDSYLKGLEAYLPLEAIQSSLQQNPHLVKQVEALSEDDIKRIVDNLKSIGLDKEFIESLLKTEIFKNKGELFN